MHRNYPESDARRNQSDEHPERGSSGSWVNHLPRGAPLPHGMTAMDAISHAVAEITPSQMMSILKSMKTFVLEDPERAAILLRENPQLAYALFQALLVYKIIDPQILNTMVSNAQKELSRSSPGYQTVPPLVGRTYPQGLSQSASYSPLPSFQHLETASIGSALAHSGTGESVDVALIKQLLRLSDEARGELPSSVRQTLERELLGDEAGPEGNKPEEI